MSLTAKQILLIELADEPQAKIAAVLTGDFELRAVAAPTSAQGDLMILDFASIGLRGLDICTKVRRNPKTESLPIVFMTNGDPEISVAAFKAGADDCIPWSAGPQELRARITARLRGAKSRGARMSFCRGKIELDAVKQSVFFCEKSGVENSVDVTPHEFRLFHYMIERESKIISRGELMEAAWNPGVNVLPRTVDKHISSLREKVKSICRIESVRQNGYVLCLAPPFDEA